MSSVNDKRAALKKAYKSQKWSKKVDEMDDDQVVAVYLRLQQQNVIKE
jgi:hypothetical protein